jgi:ferrous-iron efflux pump FieF
MFHPKTAALVAFIISCFLVVGKAVLWILSGSSTVLASLADSLQDCFLSATGFLALRYAMQPADADHRHGHGKMEAIAALGQATFITVSSLYIILDSIRRFSHEKTIEFPALTIGFIIVAIILNLGLIIYQNMVIKRSQSLVIEAERAHYAGDIGIHAGVILAVMADVYLGLSWADPAIAIIIALWLARLAYSIGIKAIHMLMDRELSEDERQEIKQIIRRTPDVLGLHDLRTHRHGQVTMISFDIEIDPSISFIDAHNIAKHVEDRLHNHYPDSEIMIHMDPCGDITDSRHRKIKKHHVQ